MTLFVLQKSTNYCKDKDSCALNIELVYMKLFQDHVVIDQTQPQSIPNNTVPEILRIFARQIEAEIVALEITLMNYPGVKCYDFTIECSKQRHRLNSNISHVFTDQGCMYTKTPLINVNNKPLHIKHASQDDLTHYFHAMANIVKERKKANCEGFVALICDIAKSHLNNPDFSNINIQVCVLNRYSHTFVYLSLENNEQGLFYDPWYYRYRTQQDNQASLSRPFVFSTSDKNHIFRQMVRNARGEYGITEIAMVHRYLSSSRKLFPEVRVNPVQAGNFSYQVVYEVNPYIDYHCNLSCSLS